MRRAIILTLTCVFALTCLASAQTGRSKLIVSVSGELQLDMADVLMDGVSYGIRRNPNNKYDVMTNDRQFKAALKKEWQGGNIRDDRIMTLAKNAGADFLCFAKINTVKGLRGKQVVVQLVDLNRNPMITVNDGMVTIKGEFEDLEHLTNIFLKTVEDMLGAGSAQAPQQSYTPPPPQQSYAPQQQQSFTDSRDGKTYRTVRIGNKTWMAENLNYQTGNSWCYDNNQSNCSRYGRLYDWNTARYVCPAGWRLPSDRDWDDLVQTAGGKAVAGKKLKSQIAGYGKNTDDYGFSALSGGYRDASGTFGGATGRGFWWGTTENGSGDAYFLIMGVLEDHVLDSDGSNLKSNGFSVRCAR